MGITVYDEWDLSRGVVLGTCNSRGRVLQMNYPPTCPGELIFLYNRLLHSMVQYFLTLANAG